MRIFLLVLLEVFIQASVAHTEPVKMNSTESVAAIRATFPNAKIYFQKNCQLGSKARLSSVGFLLQSSKAKKASLHAAIAYKDAKSSTWKVIDLTPSEDSGFLYFLTKPDRHEDYWNKDLTLKLTYDLAGSKTPTYSIACVAPSTDQEINAGFAGANYKKPYSAVTDKARLHLCFQSDDIMASFVCYSTLDGRAPTLSFVQEPPEP
jgi:hypothetical protein